MKGEASAEMLGKLAHGKSDRRPPFGGCARHGLRRRGCGFGASVHLVLTVFLGRQLNLIAQSGAELASLTAPGGMLAHPPNGDAGRTAVASLPSISAEASPFIVPSSFATDSPGRGSFSL